MNTGVKITTIIIIIIKSLRPPPLIRGRSIVMMVSLCAFLPVRPNKGQNRIGGRRSMMCTIDFFLSKFGGSLNLLESDDFIPDMVIVSPGGVKVQ